MPNLCQNAFLCKSTSFLLGGAIQGIANPLNTEGSDFGQKAEHTELQDSSPILN
jgi:hypothetical protein